MVDDTAAFIPPRVGGGKDEDSAWVGGSVVNPIKRPKSTTARRPTEFKSIRAVEKECCEGLDSEKRLGLEDEKDYRITFTSWIDAIRAKMEHCGMDGIFRILSKDHSEETYILKDWGQYEPSVIKTWVKDLRKGLPKDDTSIDACPYDIDNLEWSGKAIANSVSLKLWSTIEKEVGYDSSGPEVFSAIIEKMQSVSDAAVRMMVGDLKNMKLKEYPGQDCESFAVPLRELVTRIEGSGAAPGDLKSLVAATFLNCEDLAFNIEATKLHTDANKRRSKLTWTEIVQENVNTYRDLVTQELWSPAQSKKASELSALTAAVNKLLLQQKGSNEEDSQSNTSNTDNATVESEGRTCNDSSRTRNWRRIAPSDPSLEVINKNDREWKWCAKCKYWNTGKRAHTTSEHRTKSQRTSEVENTAEQNGEGRLAQVDNIRLMPSLFKLEDLNKNSRPDHFRQAGCFQVWKH